MEKAAERMYSCSTCGLVTTSKGHLCSPVPVSSLKVVKCGYCGEVSTDPRHVCQPKLVTLKFFCENCGRLANTKGMLCRPKAIPKGSSRSRSGKTSNVSLHNILKRLDARTSKKKVVKARR